MKYGVIALGMSSAGMEGAAAVAAVAARASCANDGTGAARTAQASAIRFTGGSSPHRAAGGGDNESV